MSRGIGKLFIGGPGAPALRWSQGRDVTRFKIEAKDGGYAVLSVSATTKRLIATYKTKAEAVHQKELLETAVRLERDSNTDRLRAIGKLGGKKSLVTMTAAERSERARKAVAAREAKRKAPKKRNA